MGQPLVPGDPEQVGLFRLRARLRESPAGIVYLGVDAAGRSVSVALLTAAAAGDAAARDRFGAAVLAETPRPDPVPRPSSAPAPGEPAPVVASLVEGDAPWVATAYEEGRPGAERFLEPVLLRRSRGLRPWRGPQFQPYWVSGPSRPAVRGEDPPGPRPDARDRDSRGLAVAVVSLAALLALLAVLLVLLFSCEPTEPVEPAPTPVPTTGSASPAPTSMTPSPRVTPPRSRTPRPTGRETVNPAGRQVRLPAGRE